MPAEVREALTGAAPRGSDRIHRRARCTADCLVQAAITYYGAYSDEVDQWIDLNEQDAAGAHAAWTTGQAAVQR